MSLLPADYAEAGPTGDGCARFDSLPWFGARCRKATRHRRELESSIRRRDRRRIIREWALHRQDGIFDTDRGCERGKRANHNRLAWRVNVTGPVRLLTRMYFPSPLRQSVA